MSIVVSRYQVVTRELADLYLQRASMLNALLDAWNERYSQATVSGLSYNPAAAEAKGASATYQKELNKIDGQIESRLVELRYLDVALQTQQG